MGVVTPAYENDDTISFGPNREEIRQAKYLVVETSNEVDATDDMEITLADYGMTTILGVIGFKHTTDNSVIETENPTTAVSAGVLTITVPGGTDDDKRIYQIFYI